MPKSTLRVQLAGFSMLYTGLSWCYGCEALSWKQHF